jgi:hypothetical protein
MKDYKYFKFFSIRLLPILVLFTIASCDGILDKEPLGRLDANSFFTSANDGIQAVNTAYSYLPFSNNNRNFYWGMATVTSDIAIAGGNGSRAGIDEMEEFTYTPRTEEFNDLWKIYYAGINQCNTITDQLPDVEMDEILKARILGEAKFLRAYYYFELSKIFGGVPILTQVLDPADLQIPRSTIEEVRQQIITDCTEAAESLPITHGEANIGRATRGAALALIAKTYLYMEDWLKVIEFVEAVEALGVYDLVPDYQDNFRKETQNNSESVWEIQHANLELGLGNFLNQWWSSEKLGAGYGFAEVTQEFVDAFENGDPRLKFTVAQDGDNYFGKVYKTSFSSTNYSPIKYLQAEEEVSQKSDGDINHTAIRYAEVLLWKAEAFAELDRTRESQMPLERVRARARAQADNPSAALPEIISFNQQDMIDAIRHERLVELGYEMHRFFDLVRWGVAEELLAGFELGKHELFPIPQTELDLNSVLEQNPGYN